MGTMDKLQRTVGGWHQQWRSRGDSDTLTYLSEVQSNYWGGKLGGKEELNHMKVHTHMSYIHNWSVHGPLFRGRPLLLGSTSQSSTWLEGVGEGNYKFNTPAQSPAAFSRCWIVNKNFIFLRWFLKGKEIYGAKVLCGTCKNRFSIAREQSRQILCHVWCTWYVPLISWGC